jgi:hypothetical protein
MEHLVLIQSFLTIRITGESWLCELLWWPLIVVRVWRGSLSDDGATAVPPIVSQTKAEHGKMPKSTALGMSILADGHPINHAVGFRQRLVYLAIAKVPSAAYFTLTSEKSRWYGEEAYSVSSDFRLLDTSPWPKREGLARPLSRALICSC